MLEKLIIIILGFFGLILLIAFVGLFTALSVMLLWNWLCSQLFHLPEIGFFQAWGLFILCGLLFKGNCTVENKK